ncbi:MULTISPECIES: helix-turn-helix domain-containing protein [Brevibacillus]|uniref:Transcriptional regulator n=1 Tax=Brevibacillus parabrevis TaxID=54914 RepID=A0A4Y3PTH4_BREPA|nr:MULTISPECIES: XRE family transcriptional regulator [Brevibacillus]MBU8715469.1 helix-turn-helix transcriptional regulator [Brevibacillus parabrevis]MDH6349589.1 transcriptional regulator with XRE-family HTH domain [Brevibacillus sp. 1238]MDR4999045.1 XRE family transcriptional regulator [Brevibacillus parabrevis]RNB93945.1 XRE family transcriptional regulator [Brevibacillus parabrevis]GEB34688.1 transcriptional regulator [Brevibacillus parabrevis]
MESIQTIIGANLETIRKKRGLSLDKVAELTGVSKGMLHQIERGDSQPTVTTLWKMATGLQVSFSSLLKAPDSAVSFVSIADVSPIIEDNGLCRAYLQFPFDPMTKLEMFRIELDPGASYSSTPHNEGVYEYITVSAGEFCLKIKDELFRMSEGDGIRFAGNVPHQYSNEGEKQAVIQVVMYYAEP